MTKLTTSEFITRATKIHGKKFDYTKTKYVDYATKLKIRCHVHGTFLQSPNSHLNGRGCSQCSAVQTSVRFKSNLATFLEKVKKVHGTKYTYKRSIYVTARTNMIVTCKLHGDFDISPNMLLVGQGCKQCGLNEVKNKLRLNPEVYIEKVLAVHGDAYDISKTLYTNSYSKVEVLCKLQIGRAHV